MKNTILLFLIGIGFSLQITNEDHILPPKYQPFINQLIPNTEKHLGNQLNSDLLECEFNEDCGENELCFGNTCEELGNVVETWVFDTFGIYDNSDCTGELEEDDDWVTSFMNQFELHDNGLIVQYTCSLFSPSGYGYWVEQEGGYIFSMVDSEGYSEENDYYVSDDYMVYNIIVEYEDICVEMGYIPGVIECPEPPTCDPVHAGVLEHSGAGIYENADCTGDIELEVYDIQVVLHEDCSLVWYDSWCPDPQSNPDFCTGDWISTDSTLTMGTFINFEYILENDKIYRESILTYMPDIYDESTWYDQCQYAEFTFVEEESISQVNPIEFSLLNVYPNPFNPETTISFELPISSIVKISIYDIKGNIVDTIIENHLTAGSHQFKWNAEGIPSGMYILNFETEEVISTQKIILMK